MKKQIISLIILVLLPMVASADAVEIGGIYYNLIPKGKAAEVTSNPKGYAGVVEIPETVTYNDVIYDVTSIGQYAFSSSSSLTDVIIPQSVKSIMSYAFSGCRLSSITIPNSVVTIGDWCFSGSGFTSVVIPNSVLTIGYGAFANCNYLKNVTIGNSVENIAGQAFDGCKALENVIIGNSVTKIDICAFRECWALEEVSLPNSIVQIEREAFADCRSLRNISIPNSVRTIGYDVFWGCSSLTFTTIGNSVGDIGGKAFYNCKQLQKVTIGSSVYSIGIEGFASCSQLTDVFCQNENPPYAGSDAFKESYSEYVTLHVPESSIEAYKTTAPWSGFGEIVPLSPYTLTYYLDVEVYKTYLHEKGIAIPAEPAPEKEGYTFSGWSEIPETMPDHYVEVTGTFTVNKYNLIYMVDGEEYKTVEIEYGAEITPEDGPEKEGYTFMGWSEIPETMPAHEVTVNGTFVKNSLGKCATPTIAFKDGKFKFESMEEGVEFVWSITVADSKEGRGNEVDINGIYKVSVYSTKADYEDSDAATIEVDIRGKQGDISGDGEVDATDITKLIDILLKKNTTTNTEQ